MLKVPKTFFPLRQKHSEFAHLSRVPVIEKLQRHKTHATSISDCVCVAVSSHFGSYKTQCAVTPIVGESRLRTSIREPNLVREERRGQIYSLPCGVRQKARYRHLTHYIGLDDDAPPPAVVLAKITNCASTYKKVTSPHEQLKTKRTSRYLCASSVSFGMNDAMH